VSDDYRRALEAAVREYEKATGERAALDARIAQLKQTIGTLSKLCGYEPTVPWSLTDACRTLLRNAAEPLSAVELKARLDAAGLDLSRYANALAAIHTVIKRLESAGEVAPADQDAARKAYAFVGSRPMPLAVRRRGRATRRSRAR
jgi:hypothetical protein